MMSTDGHDAPAAGQGSSPDAAPSTGNTASTGQGDSHGNGHGNGNGHGHGNGKSQASLMLGAMGVVYGDIGTSPLYALRECLMGEGATADVAIADVYGIISLIFWSIMLVVTLKYVVVIMRADNRGNGGILSLMALASGAVTGGKTKLTIPILGMIGAALFFGDSMITPAISVLSAVEGVTLHAPGLEHWVVPATIVIIVLLFSVQRRGTEMIGRAFGPVMCLWFTTLGVMGLSHVIGNPQILGALSPHHAITYLFAHGTVGLIVLGSVFLAVTGAEALYLDMGHFGRGPITKAWLWLVMPALVMNYLGQGALILSNPEAIKNPFYLMAPEWGLLPLVGLSTLATVIASQAVISGAFSLSQQAVQLGLLPRLPILHTSEEIEGQIYVPLVNWGLLVGIIFLVLAFKSSSNLAAAYGIAVTGAMAMDTCLAFLVARRLWNWSMEKSLGLFVPFLFIDLVFLFSNATKIPDGGWFPILAGIVAFVLMSTWREGRALLFTRLKEDSIELTHFVDRVKDGHPPRVPGTAVFLSGQTDIVPNALLHTLKHYKVLHARVVILTVVSKEVPRVKDKERVMLTPLGKGFYRMIVKYGYMESPDIPRALEATVGAGLKFDMMETSFILSHESLIPRMGGAMAFWREKVFVWMQRNATSATEFFRVPSNRVVELGSQIEL